MNYRLIRVSKQAGFCFLCGLFFSATFSKGLAQVFGGLAVVSGIIIYINDKKYRRLIRFDSFMLFAALYVGWSILAALFGSDPARSFRILGDEWLFLLIPAIAVLISGERNLQTVVRLFAVSSIIVSLYAIWQHFSGYDLYRGIDLIPAPTTGYRSPGFFANVMTFGNYFVVTSLFFLGAGTYIEKAKDKALLYAAFFFSAVGGLMAYGRGPLLALAVGLIIYLVLIGRKYYKTVLPILAGFIICIFIFAPDILSRHINELSTELEGTYAGSRLAIWRNAERMIEDNPVLGVGPGNVGQNYARYRDPRSNRVYTHVHNDFLNIACNAGLLAVIFYIGLWGAIFRKIRRHITDTTIPPSSKGVTAGVFLASVVFLTTSFYEATFDDLEIRILLMVLWGLFYAVSQGVKMSAKTAD